MAPLRFAVLDIKHNTDKQVPITGLESEDDDYYSKYNHTCFRIFKHQEFAIKSLFLHLLNAYDMSAQRCLYHLIVLIFNDFLTIFSSDLDKN